MTKNHFRLNIRTGQNEVSEDGGPYRWIGWEEYITMALGEGVCCGVADGRLMFRYAASMTSDSMRCERCGAVYKGNILTENP